MLKEQPRKAPAPPKSFNGGGGLYSTTEDYVRFMQMFLRRGKGAGDTRILRAETVDLMTANHIGDTRGENWYTDMVCLAVDATLTNVDQAKALFGISPPPTQRYGGT